MKDIELLIKAEIAKGRENLLYELLGKFGDRFTEWQQVELRSLAQIK